MALSLDETRGAKKKFFLQRLVTTEERSNRFEVAFGTKKNLKQVSAPRKTGVGQGEADDPSDK